MNYLSAIGSYAIMVREVFKKPTKWTIMKSLILKEIDELIDSAIKYNFIALHVLPSWVPVIKEKMIAAGIYDEAGFRSTAERYSLIGSPVGFPSGGNTLTVKKEEARKLLEGL